MNRDNVGGRPEKESFDYFNLKVNYYTDPNLQDVYDEFGPVVELVYVRILCLVFGAKGYYIKLDKSRLTNQIYRSLKHKFGPKKELVESIITRMAEVTLLDKNLLNSGVVTSHGIQMAFMKMATRRRKKITEFSLLSKAEMVEFGVLTSEVIASETGVIVTETSVIDAETHQSKVKERKANKSEEDELKINNLTHNGESYFIPSCWTKVLIDRGLISSSDLKIPNYNKLFDEVLNNYDQGDMVRALNYILDYLKHPSKRIDDLYAFIRHSLINNTDWVSHEDERLAYFESISRYLDELKAQEEEDFDNDDLPF